MTTDPSSRLGAAERIAEYGERVAHREVAEAVERLDDGDGLSSRERAVLATMAGRVVRGALPGPAAVAAVDADDETVAATVDRLFDEDP
ncbi:hypothetical protein [Halorubellus sp. PRR65]|uniref:hypothetical protein n=1 Tax=Halorubellus sp. PRR65 TaxID=3098148 RepID=UPI002B25BC90|nr:hypothetical protein [Halorubellus sp. PRR65]